MLKTTIKGVNDIIAYLESLDHHPNKSVNNTVNNVIEKLENLVENHTYLSSMTDEPMTIELSDDLVHSKINFIRLAYKE